MSVKRAYLKYVEARIGQGRRDDLVGGGLINSLRGWTAVMKMRSALERIKGDECISGDGDFVIIV